MGCPVLQINPESSNFPRSAVAGLSAAAVSQAEHRSKGDINVAKARSKAVSKSRNSTASDGKALLDNAVGQIEKMFGEGSIMKLNSAADSAGYGPT